MTSSESNRDQFPEPEVDAVTGRLIYRMGLLDQFALFPDIPSGAKVTLQVVRSRDQTKPLHNGTYVASPTLPRAKPHALAAKDGGASPPELRDSLSST